MKKLPLVFCFLSFGCAEPKVLMNNGTTFNIHRQPYRVASVGKWNQAYSVITLVDANNSYFTVKTNYTPSLKKGDTYTPEDRNGH